MLTALAVSLLAFNPANLSERKPGFDPVRADVSIDGDTVEILAFEICEICNCAHLLPVTIEVCL